MTQRQKLLVGIGLLLFALMGAGLVVQHNALRAAQESWLEVIPQEAPTLWSLREGPYKYVGDETTEAVETIYGTSYWGVGQAQYKGVFTACFLGTALEPVDGTEEAWCVTWKYDAATGKWLADAPHLWGTKGQYQAWVAEWQELAD